MSKTQYVMDPAEITMGELKAMAGVCGAVKRYVDAMDQFLPSDPAAKAGQISVQGCNGLPVLRFTPKRTAITELMRNKIT